MIKGERKANADQKQQGQHGPIRQRGKNQAGEIDDKDDRFCSHNVGHDRAHKKAFLAFEDYPARFAAVL